MQLISSRICTGFVCSFVGNTLVGRMMGTVVAWALTARLGDLHDKQLVME